MNFSVVSLGCKVNQSEGEDIAAGLSAAGLEPAGRGEAADVIIVNTCTVTGEADRKSRKAIYQAVKRRAGETALVVVTGCYASVAAADLAAIEGVSLVVGQAGKSGLVEQVVDHARREARPREVASSPNTSLLAMTEQRDIRSARSGAARASGSSNGDGSNRPDEIASFRSQRQTTSGTENQLRNDRQNKGQEERRVRAYLKVQDGCDNRCAYCIVPDARGNPVSVPESEVLMRAGDLTGAGAREIILTGINVGKYGNRPAETATATNQPRKDKATNLAELIAKVLTVPDVARVRLSSIEPEDVTLDLIGFLADARNDSLESRNESIPYLCPHLHIPLQAGDNRTLKRMGRRYVTGEFQRLINSIRHANPDAAFTTDLIVGFPGETDEEFANTMRFLDAVRPARMHVFQYSRRAGTPAADMPDQVADSVKAARSRQAREAGERYAAEYRASFTGREVEVLVERVKDGVATGTTETYLAVSFDAADAKPGDIIRRAL